MLMKQINKGQASQQILEALRHVGIFQLHASFVILYFLLIYSYMYYEPVLN